MFVQHRRFRLKENICIGTMQSTLRGIPINIETGKEFKITSPEIIQCADELHDTPNMPSSYRNAGWTENDKSLLVYDRFDIWQVDPENQNEPR